MFVYFGRRFDAANVDACFVGVQCEKCGGEYYYHLARIGIASGTAPYLIGQQSAANAAEEKSLRAAQNRLASEAELVPCPKCNWINEESVRGYRRGRYRGFLKAALFGGIFGAAVSVVFWWFFHLGAPKDRYLAPYFLYGGIALSVTWTLALIAMQQFLRRSIQPNYNYPLPPRLPPGTPPALLKDKESGELRPAKPDIAFDPDGWLDFQIGRHQFPLQCCDCLKPATTEHAHKTPVSGSFNLEIPQCAACANKMQRYTRFGWSLLAAICVLVAGMALMLNTGLIVLFLVGVPLAMLRLRIPGPVEAKILDDSRGVVRLRFRNPEYGRLVAQQFIETDEFDPTVPTSGSSEFRAVSPREIKKKQADT